MEEVRDLMEWGRGGGIERLARSAWALSSWTSVGLPFLLLVTELAVEAEERLWVAERAFSRGGFACMFSRSAAAAAEEFSIASPVVPSRAGSSMAQGRPSGGEILAR